MNSKARASSETPDEQRDRQAEIEAARMLVERRTGIVLSGRIVNGKVELDQSTLDDIAKNFADADKSFVAVNAPFDPLPSAL
jgi:hypothetical protein